MQRKHTAGQESYWGRKGSNTWYSLGESYLPFGIAAERSGTVSIKRWKQCFVRVITHTETRQRLVDQDFIFFLKNVQYFRDPCFPYTEISELIKSFKQRSIKIVYSVSIESKYCFFENLKYSRGLVSTLYLLNTMSTVSK